MRRRAGLAILGLVVLLAVAAFVAARISRPDLVLTGIVTTNDVVVSPLVGGELSRLLVTEGDTVKRGQLLATSTTRLAACTRATWSPRSPSSS